MFGLCLPLRILSLHVVCLLFILQVQVKFLFWPKAHFFYVCCSGFLSVTFEKTFNEPTKSCITLKYTQQNNSLLDVQNHAVRGDLVGSITE